MNHEFQTPVPATTFRDPFDVAAIHRLGSLVILLTLLLAVSLAGNFLLYLRRPDLVVVDKSSGRVEQINDRQFGQTNAVTLSPDSVKDSDKTYLGEQFLKTVYTVDPVTRKKDMLKALSLMTPGCADQYFAWLKSSQQLQIERNENWQSTWTVQESAVAPADKYLLDFLGVQHVVKVLDGQTVEESRQYRCSLRLAVDPRGRVDQNIRTGLRIIAFDAKLIDGPRK